MKSFLNYLIPAIVLVSCAPSPQGGLDQLMAKRDSIKNARAELATMITELDAQIAAMDTTGGEGATNVTTLNLGRSRFEHFFTVQGVVETDRNAQIFPEVPAKVTSIAVKEGDRVSKGQLLMTLDAKVVSNQMDEFRSRLSLAETVYKKQEKLWEQKIGSEIQYLEAKNNYESLKQTLETLQAQKAMYSIAAPFDGIVDEVLPKEGEMANPAMPVVRLINMNEAYIKADVTERYLGKIKSGDSVTVSFPSMGSNYSTTIDRIGNFINPNNRTFKIRVGLSNTNQSLKPNLLGELKIRDYVADSAVVVPASLVQMTPSGETFVYTMEDNIAKKVSVKTGMSYNDRMEILSGLTGNETLIDKGARSIKDGEIVNPTSI